MANVLVVDDEPAVVRLLRVLLASEGFQVLEALSGSDALGLVREHNPDLILLDLHMPVMDGRTLYRAVRDAGYRGLVFICSAFGAPQAREELGADGAIEKPYEPEHLVSVIKDAFTRRARGSEA
jgi:CheY-like chemotaxis protein